MDDTSEVISRLKFLAKINKGEKINTRHGSHLSVQPDGILTSISRSFFNTDNRDNAITFIVHAFKRGFELMEKFASSMTTYDKAMTANLHHDIYNSLAGLENLKATYATDVMFCCKIDTIIQETVARLIQTGEKYNIQYNKPESANEN